jgi:hypothetical protein
MFVQFLFAVILPGIQQAGFLIATKAGAAPKTPGYLRLMTAA